MNDFWAMFFFGAVIVFCGALILGAWDAHLLDDAPWWWFFTFLLGFVVLVALTGWVVETLK